MFFGVLGATNMLEKVEVKNQGKFFVFLHILSHHHYCHALMPGKSHIIYLIYILFCLCHALLQIKNEMHK